MNKELIFIAVDPCIPLYNSEAALTVGKEYVVIDYILEENQLSIIDDQGNKHWFTIFIEDEDDKLFGYCEWRIKDE